MATEREYLETAKELIKQKRFVDARAILRKMPNNPTAQQWLRKLDELDPPLKASSSKGIYILGVILLLIVLIAGGFLVIRSMGEDDSQPDVDVVEVPTITETPLETPTSTRTPTLTRTPLPTETLAPTDSARPTNTARPRDTATPAALRTTVAPPSPSPTITVSPTATNCTIARVVDPAEFGSSGFEVLQGAHWDNENYLDHGIPSTFESVFGADVPYFSKWDVHSVVWPVEPPSDRNYTWLAALIEIPRTLPDPQNRQIEDIPYVESIRFTWSRTTAHAQFNAAVYGWTGEEWIYLGQPYSSNTINEAIGVPVRNNLTHIYLYVAVRGEPGDPPATPILTLEYVEFQGGEPNTYYSWDEETCSD